MAFFVGTSGDDNITGTGDPDMFDLSQGGNDTAIGDNEEDTFYMGAAFTDRDHIDGSDNFNNTLVLDGDYSWGVVFKPGSIVNIRTVSLGAGHSYNLTTTDASVAASSALSVMADNLGPADSLIFDGSREKDAGFFVQDGAGDDHVIASRNGDALWFTMGGTDVVEAGGGDDNIQVERSTFSRADSYDGGVGHDSLTVAGGGNGTVALNADTITNIEILLVESADRLKLVMDDGNVGSGKTLYVTVLVGLDHIDFFFDGRAELDGSFNINGGFGSNKLIGGAGDDHFALLDKSTVQGGAGDDTFSAGDISAIRRIDGGSGDDTLTLSGFTDAVMKEHTIADVETIRFFRFGSYLLTSNDANVAAGAMLTLDAHTLGSVNTLTFDGSAETDGNFAFLGGDGADTLTGGALADSFDGSRGDDTIAGGGGADSIDSGAGADVFRCGGAPESTGIAHDTIVRLYVGEDRFDLDVSVTAYEGKVSGEINSATFDDDIGAAAAGLAAFDAIVIRATGATDLSGHVFLVVDADTVSGYQAGGDYVFDVTGIKHLGLFGTDSFI